MTGFGQSEVTIDTYNINVEIKSVNHRFCEFNIRMPKRYQYLEEKVKKTVSSIVNRGRIEVFISVEGGTNDKHLSVDWQLLSLYIKELQNAKEKFQISSPIEISDILKLEDVFIISESEKGFEVEKPLLEQVMLASEQLVSMRSHEGEQLKEDVLEHLSHIEELTDRVKESVPLVVESYRKRMEVRLKDFIVSQIDEQRILAEAAIFADKADINEEIKRIHSHLSQFRHSLQSTTPVGRKLDFLVQELNREVNTIGSKGNDAKIANLVVDMKACLEKIKEQVQNIE